MKDLQEKLMKIELPISKNTLLDNKIQKEYKEDNIKLLIGTIHDLINVIELRINLNQEEKKYIQKIKDNMNI